MGCSNEKVCKDNKECLLSNEFTRLSDKSDFNLITKQMKKSLCRIKTNNDIFSNGFLCSIKISGSSHLPVLITNYIEKEPNSNENISFYFENGRSSYNLNLDNSRTFYTNEIFNVSIIEIKESDNLRIPDNFLQIDERKIDSDNINIYLIQYTIHNEYKYSFGKIKSIEENAFEHLCSSDSGSSGAPILGLSNYRIIGIHKGINKANNNGYGIFIEPIAKEFMSFYLKNNLNSIKIIKSHQGILKDVINEENDKIDIYFKFENGKSLYLEATESMIFEDVLKKLYDKYLWLKYIKIKGYKYN